MFRDTARLSSQGFGTQPVDVEVFYDTSMHVCFSFIGFCCVKFSFCHYYGKVCIYDTIILYIMIIL